MDDLWGLKPELSRYVWHELVHARDQFPALGMYTPITHKQTVQLSLQLLTLVTLERILKISRISDTQTYISIMSHCTQKSRHSVVFILSFTLEFAAREPAAAIKMGIGVFESLK